jgi:hypothetical protein
MYLSDRDLQWALSRKTLIVQPPEGVAPPKVDPTSIDIRLDHVREAKIWDVETFARKQDISGVGEAEVHLGRFKFGAFSEEYLISPPP